VVVNLLTGKATGFTSIKGIRSVVGSAFNDVLTGDDLSNLLIGGGGANQIGGGEGEDILIGGSLVYDAERARAVVSIMKEWTRSDADYTTRINHLRNGGGLNGPYRLNTSTVSPDAGGNTLTGSSDALDWFFAQLSLDVITDLNLPGPEQVN